MPSLLFILENFCICICLYLCWLSFVFAHIYLYLLLFVFAYIWICLSTSSLYFLQQAAGLLRDTLQTPFFPPIGMSTPSTVHALISSFIQVPTFQVPWSCWKLECLVHLWFQIVLGFCCNPSKEFECCSQPLRSQLDVCAERPLCSSVSSVLAPYLGPGGQC